MFAESQHTYTLDFGDGTTAEVSCETPDPEDGSVCDQFAPLAHTYAAHGTYQIQLLETFTGAGSEEASARLALSITD
jgi:hypothetical protein